MPIVIIGQPIGELWFVLAIVAAVWVIYDVLKHHKNWTDERKILWIAAAVLFSIITAIVYYFVVKKK